jgi:peptidyl-prolyl cis-trans isomerase D
MTMLDRMRRHKGWLKWSLAIVVVAFIFLYIPDFLREDGRPAGANDVVATVDGREITVARFRRVYLQQMQAYRNAYGGNMDERLLKQLGVDQRILQGLIEEEAALAEAARLGIGASDQEVVARIQSLPAFQEGGRFIGEPRYRQVLQMQNPPLRTDEFEEQVRRGIVMEKLQGALTDWVTVSEADVDQAFRRRNEMVQLAVVHFSADQHLEATTANDDEVASWFESRREDYRVAERRQVRYALLDMQAIRERTQIPPDEIERYYRDNQDQFSTPEEVRASHILFLLEDRDEAEVRKQAEAVLKRARAGEDFARLANQHTEEEVGRARGGDLDYFGRGQMAREFEEAAFALQPGEISDLVRTPFGLHIIKVTDRREVTMRALDEVRGQIEDQLKWERAQEEAQRTADDLDRLITRPSDLDSVAGARGLTVGDSGFFARTDPISGLGMAPAVSERAFAMQTGEVSDAIRTPQGFAFVTVTGVEAARLPELDEVRARVRDDLVRSRAIETARERAAAIAPKLRAGKFEAAAKTAGLEVQTTELMPRGSAIPDVGISPEIDAVAFDLPAGAVSEPIRTARGAAIVRVVERKDVTEDEVVAGRPQLRDELLNERRNRFYAAYMAKARERMRIQQNPAVMAQVTA